MLRLRVEPPCQVAAAPANALAPSARCATNEGRRWPAACSLRGAAIEFGCPAHQRSLAASHTAGSAPSWEPPPASACSRVSTARRGAHIRGRLPSSRLTFFTTEGVGAAFFLGACKATGNNNTSAAAGEGRPRIHAKLLGRWRPRQAAAERVKWISPHHCCFSLLAPRREKDRFVLPAGACAERRGGCWCAAGGLARVAHLASAAARAAMLWSDLKF